MNRLTFTLCASRNAPALLTLPEPQTAQDLLELEQAVAGTLAHLGRELFGASGATASLRATQGSQAADAADAEYASWLPDPGAIEVASWAAHLRSAAH